MIGGALKVKRKITGSSKYSFMRIKIWETLESDIWRTYELIFDNFLVKRTPGCLKETPHS